MKTVLFDLDGTLLPMDQEAFIKAYFGGLATKLVPYGYDPQKLIQAIWTGTEAMIRNDGQCTNEEAFWKGSAKVLGEGFRKDEPIFDDFYNNEFRFVSTSCGFAPQSAQIIAMLKEKGCRLILATNPIFPAIATHGRIQWAGLRTEDFQLITTYENSHYCKPNPAYYREILGKIGEDPQNCLMIGNDVTEDMIARELGMEVFLLTDCMINKSGKDIATYPNGDFSALRAFLEERI